MKYNILNIIKLMLFVLIIENSILLTPSPIYAVSDKNIRLIFNKANSLYEDGFYDEALDYYLKLEELNIFNPYIFYNIGNSYMKKDNMEIGKAILYYNRALYYGNDPKILENLELARSLVISDNNQRTISNSDTLIFQIFDFFSNLLTINLITILIIIIFTFFAIFLMLHFILMCKYKFILVISIIFSLLFVLFCSLLFLRVTVDLGTNYGVIINDNSEAFLAPSNKQPLLFTLSEGAEVEIKRKISDRWYLISLPNRVEGYIESKNLEIIYNFKNNDKYSE